MQLRHAALTDVGCARDHNEDTFRLDATERPEGTLFVVCDGAGGLAAGETASDVAISAIMEVYYATPGSDRSAALRAAFIAANAAVYEQGKGHMGTTGVAAVCLNDAVIVANVGDSRALLVRGGKVKQISRDHSFVAEQVAAGVITAEQARVSSYRNIITRALGNRPDVDVDLFREPLVVGDRIVLCSDGLHGQVEPEEIAQAVTLVGLDQAVERLVALANERGGPDNITVVVIEVAQLSFATSEGHERTARLAADEPTAEIPVVRPAHAPAAPRSAAPRPAPAPAVTPPLADSGRRPFLGWLFVALVLLALIGTLAWFIINQPAPTVTPTPVVPALTPVRATTATVPPVPSAGPTLIPTAATTATTAARSTATP